MCFAKVEKKKKAKKGGEEKKKESQLPFLTGAFSS